MKWWEEENILDCVEHCDDGKKLSRLKVSMTLVGKKKKELGLFAVEQNAKTTPRQRAEC